MYKILCDGVNEIKDQKAEKPTVIQFENDEATQEQERKKRTQEDLVTDFVTILEQMMNPRQAITSFISAITGLVAIIIGSIFIYRLPDTSIKARKLVAVLIIYGVLQILMATAYFVTCMQTSIAVFRGIKDMFQIIVGLLLALVYVLISLVSMIMGIFGFYKIVALVNFVEFTDTASSLYCPQIVFYTSLIIFVLHIILIITRCCCCK